MNEKPSYLGLLNAISNAEGDAQQYLAAWAATTQREDVKAIISTVALREGEHSLAFAKRMCELGYEVQPREDPKCAQRMAIASSCTLSDFEKFEQLGLGEPVAEGAPDVFTSMFADTTIDIQTGGLLGRYIAEERDSGRLFRSCREVLECEAATAAPAASAERLDRIEALLEQLVTKLGS